MIDSAPDLQLALQERGLVQEDSLVRHTSSLPKTERPWFITLLLGASGWVAGLFLLVFIGLVVHPRQAAGALATGLVLIVVAWGLFKFDRKGIFVSQLALALSIAGQIILVYGLAVGLDELFESMHSARPIALILFFTLLLQAVMALIMPNPLHKTLSTLVACIAWAFSVRFGLFGETNFRFGDSATLAPPLGLTLTSWALAWSPVVALIYTLVRTEASWMARGWQPVIRPILTGLIIGLAYATLASHPLEVFHWWGNATPLAQQNWLALWPMLSALGSLGALLSAFAMGSRALVGACVLAILAHLSHFYYELGTSLLIKALIMLVMGSVMLLAAHVLSKEQNR